MDNLNLKTPVAGQASQEIRSFKTLLNPVFVRRVVGAPAGINRLLSDGSASERVLEMKRLDDELPGLVEAAIGILERAMPILSDDSLRKQILNTKRDLYNSRFSKVRNLACLENVVDSPDWECLDRLVSTLERKRTLEQGMADGYHNDMAFGREQLRGLFENYNIKNGLIYSNPQLYKELCELYYSNRTIKAKKQRNLEHKLCLYLSRASTKTSPMTTFTTVQNGRWAEDDSAGDIRDMAKNASYAVRHDIKFSAAVAQHIVEPLLKDFKNIAPFLKLKLNEALRISGDKVTIVQTLSRTKMNPNMFGNVKGEVTTQLNPLLKAVIEIFRAEGNAALDVKDICQSFIAKLGDQAREPVMKALEHLYRHQIVQPDYVWHEQEDALLQVVDLLANIHTDKARQLVGVFKEMQTLLNDYLTRDLDERFLVRGKIVQLVEQATEIAECVLSAKEIDPPFYEDAFIENGNELIYPHSTISDFHDDLNAWLEMSPVLSANMAIQTAISTLFKQQFGADGVCANPREFLESADRVLTSGEGEINGFLGPYKIPAALAAHPDLQKLQTIRQRLVDGILTSIKGDEEISLNREWLKDLSKEIPESIANRAISHSYFGQLIEGKNKETQFVINQTLVGHGILFSRFLDDNDAESIVAMKSYLRELSGDVTVAELPGVFGFNANYHARLFDNELAIETHKPNYADTRKISLEACELVYRKETDRVYLRDRELGLVEPIYMGFLTPIYLPEITRLLSINYSHGIVVFILAQMIQSGWLDLESEKFIPRVNLGNVVLWRKSWVYPKKNLPSYDLPEHEFFRQLLIWKVERGLADEMFVRFGPVVSKTLENDTEADEQGNIDWTNVDFTAMKPSYINFRNPTIVQSFQKLLRRFSKLVIFQEALPIPGDSSCELDGEKYVNELQLELSRIVKRG